jgi:hypothetical protein
MCKATFRYCLSRKDPLILIIQRYNRESRLTIVAAEVYFRHCTKSLSNYGRTCVNCTSLPLACFVYHSLYAHTRYYFACCVAHTQVFVCRCQPSKPPDSCLSYYPTSPPPPILHLHGIHVRTNTIANCTNTPRAILAVL